MTAAVVMERICADIDAVAQAQRAALIASAAARFRREPGRLSMLHPSLGFGSTPSQIRAVCDGLEERAGMEASRFGGWPLSVNIAGARAFADEFEMVEV